MYRFGSKLNIGSCIEISPVSMEEMGILGTNTVKVHAALPYSSSGNRDQDIDARKQQMHYEERRPSMNQTYFSWQHRILPNIHPTNLL
ncbi:hypothetical protein CEXT_798431 [Caerostris extrusa]|uniref:Uncharacterized protein n=1 Tax=Caerostris extrusa TaxID=172846 RepID=A0AAV4WS98_CAEEX|nr:hypothetical protein CEXT_798431 [Caerostris extrusa]